MKNHKLLTTTFSLLAITLLSACGGGGSSDSDSTRVIEGLLSQGETVSHTETKILNFKHSAGENIEGVEICAQFSAGDKECSTTDGKGQWGFGAPTNFNGGAVEFFLKGHGIDTTKMVNVPAKGNSIFIHFENVDGKVVNLHGLEIDGVSQKIEGEEDHHHDE